MLRLLIFAASPARHLHQYMYGWKFPLFQAFIWFSLGVLFPLPDWCVVALIPLGIAGVISGFSPSLRLLALIAGCWICGSEAFHRIPPEWEEENSFRMETVVYLESCQRMEQKFSRWEVQVIHGNIKPGTRLMLSFPYGTVPRPQPGQLWAVRGYAGRNAGNYGGFNPIKWLQSVNCLYLAQVHNACDAVFLRQMPPLPLSLWRKKVADKLDHPALSPTDKGFLQALLLGDKSELNREFQQNFTISGLSHILAVSGMHVALVFAGVALLVKLLPNHHFLFRLLKFLLPCAMIWAFVWLSGAGASSVRAGIMCTFVQAGVLVRRPTNSLNLLGLAGLLICIPDPASWFNAGFQLSFLAVAGILLWNPIFSKPIPEGWKGKLLEGIPVSLSAQITTTPVSLYYFGQFPVWFLLTNLVAVPLSTLLMYLAILTLLLAFLHISFTPLFQLLHILIAAMDWVSRWPSHLPMGVIQNIEFGAIPAGILTALTLALPLMRRGHLPVLFSGLFACFAHLHASEKNRDHQLEFRPRAEYVEVRANGSLFLLGTREKIPENLEPYPRLQLPLILQTELHHILLTHRRLSIPETKSMPCLWLGKNLQIPTEHYGWIYQENGRWKYLPPVKSQK